MSKFQLQNLSHPRRGRQFLIILSVFSLLLATAQLPALLGTGNATARAEATATKSTGTSPTVSTAAVARPVPQPVPTLDAGKPGNTPTTQPGKHLKPGGKRAALAPAACNP